MNWRASPFFDNKAAMRYLNINFFCFDLKKGIFIPDMKREMKFKIKLILMRGIV